MGNMMPKTGRAQQETLRTIALEKKDFLAETLRKRAIAMSEAHPLPPHLEAWKRYRADLKQRILVESRTHVQHDLALDFRETKKQVRAGYSVRNIRFQTQPSLYATASLYVPAGTGKFPAVIVTHGHWPGGRSNELFQSVALSLVTNGYVCLVMDAWGAGERTSSHGEDEYHGSNLGASLLNIGETLLGLQLTDNIRGVDLLQSLDFVDADRIGATGASGGGNQAMWLAAVDDRVRAVIPVVSVGTFQSYVMNSNCICELLPNGLTFTEEDGVLALIAPRALKIFSAQRDTNPSFQPAQMLRSFQQTQDIYRQYGEEEKCAYEIFDTGHGYWPEMRLAMLAWFHQWLKGGSKDDLPREEKAFQLLPKESLLTYSKGQREKEVLSTADFCQSRGAQIYAELLHQPAMHREERILRLKKLIGLEEGNRLRKSHADTIIHQWEQCMLETSNGKKLTVLWSAPKQGNSRYQLFIHHQGRAQLPPDKIKEALDAGDGVVLLDLWGIGAQASTEAIRIDGSLPPFHTLSRSLLWLGKTVMAEWVDDIRIVGQWLEQEKQGQLYSIVAFKETGLAALIYGVLVPSLKKIINYDMPYSYRFDDREGVDFYHMAIHIPDILPWGDVVTLVALNHASVEVLRTRSISGHLMEGDRLEQIRQEYAAICARLNSKNKVVFHE